jgi:hypothetical protein
LIKGQKVSFAAQGEQTPFLHASIAAAGQTSLHAPQLLLSLVGSAQCPWQHSCPTGQAVPHAPQLWGSSAV